MTKTKLKRIIMMAGGTGGHVFPGLAIAEYFREQGIEVDWLGTQKGLEARIVPAAGIPIHYISISGVRGKGIKDAVFAPLRLVSAVIQAMRYIRTLQPDVVIGMGGFVSGPGGLACWLLRKKLVIHEQNAKPGMTNQWLSILADKVLEGFPNTFKKRTRVVTTGNPVRREIASIKKPTAKKFAQPMHLLVVGGSLGAKAINELLPNVLAKIPAAMRPFVMHQTGEAHYAETVKRYQALNVAAEVVPFIHDMQKAYTSADMVLCRAGALTIAELCAAGLGAILVPYPYATDDHQTANAKVMARQDAALLIQQAVLTQDVLLELLKSLSSASDKRYAMAKAAYALRKIDATEKVFAICEEICH